MIEIKSYEEFRQLKDSGRLLLLYVSSPQCGVCAADRPRVEALARQFACPIYEINIAHTPEAAGQLSLFTAPAVLLYYAGREYHRQARFIDFAELSYRLKELNEFTQTLEDETSADPDSRFT